MMGGARSVNRRIRLRNNSLSGARTISNRFENITLIVVAAVVGRRHVRPSVCVCVCVWRPSGLGRDGTLPIRRDNENNNNNK